MTWWLSKQQRQALACYEALKKSHGELFKERERRPIVTNQKELRAFARKHGVVLGVVADLTPYMWVINDLVKSRDKSGELVPHTYLRLIDPPDEHTPPGVVVLATLPHKDTVAEKLIVLVEQERHATGVREWELPRGFGETRIYPAVQALDELKRETGYLGEQATCLGTTLTDSGTTNRSVSFFHVPVTGQTVPSPETYEAIARKRLVTRDELWRSIDSGKVHDAFTVQALALYEHRLGAQRPDGADCPELGE